MICSNTCEFFDLYGCFSISFDYFINWGGGTSLLTIGVTALLMNSRQLFYSLSFIDVFNKMKQKWYMIFTMTDETYAVNCNLEDQDKEQVMFYVALFSRCY